MLGREVLQLGEFVVLTVMFSVIGFWWSLLSPAALVALYCLAEIFSTFGPNTITFILLAEVFPTRYQSTGHGISAAVGEAGGNLLKL